MLSLLLFLFLIGSSFVGGLLVGIMWTWRNTLTAVENFNPSFDKEAFIRHVENNGRR